MSETKPTVKPVARFLTKTMEEKDSLKFVPNKREHIENNNMVP